ncbi:hypothetical protein BESB_006360 [Besnoitia besnoiti]|uniref:Uncharacterized protein n=1 Tax=Besnoitia besnoiti TaxID=94643 RepID=A0A2A9MJZ3_BESBE|nr:hypothetical protein BESB_006360 [Besnoitia besnoiti]PFH38295.1 hypothetical protein BESB_006360 [Besnoitia besnoiti]
MADTARRRRCQGYANSRLACSRRLVPPYGVDDCARHENYRTSAALDRPSFCEAEASMRWGDAHPRSPVPDVLADNREFVAAGHGHSNRLQDTPATWNLHPSSHYRFRDYSPSFDRRTTPPSRTTFDGEVRHGHEVSSSTPAYPISRGIDLYRHLRETPNSPLRHPAPGEKDEGLQAGLDAASKRTQAPESVYAADYVDHFAAGADTEDSLSEEPPSVPAPQHSYPSTLSAIQPCRNALRRGLLPVCDLPHCHTCSPHAERACHCVHAPGVGSYPCLRAPYSCAAARSYAPLERDVSCGCFCGGSCACDRCQMQQGLQSCRHTCFPPRRAAPAREWAPTPLAGSPSRPACPAAECYADPEEDPCALLRRRRSSSAGAQDWRSQKLGAETARSGGSESVTPCALGLPSFDPKDYKYLPLCELRLVPPAGIPTTKFRPVTRF